LACASGRCDRSTQNKKIDLEDGHWLSSLDTIKVKPGNDPVVAEAESEPGISVNWDHLAPTADG